MSLSNIIVLIATFAGALIVFWPRLASSIGWKAAITPLASIIGSGFLVLGPILIASYGHSALVVMAGLCLTAYLFGAAIRYNIAALADMPEERQPTTVQQIERISSWVLAVAYIISVAYYLNLLGAFALSLTPFATPFNHNLATSAAFLIILAIGWTRGFTALEWTEQLSVGIKLSIIAGLLAGLIYFFGEKLSADALIINPVGKSGWAGVTLAFGLIITVQGFETSRYLGEEYDAATRVKSMRLAQLVSTAIYIVYIGLIAFVFSTDGMKLTETSIIDEMRVVAPILPALLVVAALAAQFSAAIADTGGSGGLMSELTHGKMSSRHGYLLLTTVGLVLTWFANIFEIINFASRAFALYYGFQALLAALRAYRFGDSHHKIIGFSALALFGLAIAILGDTVQV
ncbi:putative protein [hydrothermal vent metagenome]|uniref:Amino acid permease n=1 Tax=hydrothermal vent metagenome TaxID=652676 RepID=A0A3B0R717_9ZZZZ